MSQLLGALGRRVRSRWRSVRTMSGGVAALVVLPVLVVVARGDGLPVERMEMSGGGAWLASPAQGLVTLIDGPTEEVVGSLPAPGARAGDALSVVQNGASAYVLNATRGTVARVDGGTYEAAVPVRFAEGGGGLSAFVGGSGLFVVDSGRRAASLTDPVSLRVRERLSLAAQPGPGQAVVDDAGRLWVVDRAGGGLTWFDGDGKHVRADVGDSRSRLVLVQGRPVLVDVTRPRVSRLSDDGSVEGWSCLEVRVGDDAELLGSPGSGRVLAAVSATGSLVSAGVDGDDCGLTLPVGKPGDVFGPLVEAAGFVFVPNRSSGRTSVVDLAGRQVVAELDLKVKAGSRVELLAKDGLVFYNDLDGDKAGVIRFDGRSWVLGKALRKYSRSAKGEGILVPAGNAVKTPAPGSGPGPGAPSPTPSPNGPTTPPEATPEPLPPLPPEPPKPDPTVTTPPPDPKVPGTPKAPAIRSLSWTPKTVVREQPVTFTARVSNAAGADWNWQIIDPATGQTLHQASTARSMTHTLPADAPDALQIKLEVNGPGGEAKPVAKPFTTSSRTPQITLTCPPTAGIQQTVSCTGQDSAVGAGDDWAWTITGPAGTDGPTQAPARRERTFTPATAGTYTVTLKVTYDGVSDEKSATVEVNDQCALTAVTASPVDVRPADQTVQVRLTNCFTTQTVTVQRASWLTTSDTSLTVTPGGTGTVTVDAPLLPPIDGVNSGALNFSLANGRMVSYDIIGNRAPVWTYYATCAPATGSVIFATDFEDADPASLEVWLTVGATTQRMQLQRNTTRGDFWWVQLGTTTLAPVSRWTFQATDAYGLKSAIGSGNRGSCW